MIFFARQNVRKNILCQCPDTSRRPFQKLYRLSGVYDYAGGCAGHLPGTAVVTQEVRDGCVCEPACSCLTPDTDGQMIMRSTDPQLL